PFNVLDTAVVRPAEPDAVDLRRGQKILERGEGAAVANSQRAGQRRSFLRALAIRAPDAAHVGVAHGLPCAHVEFCDESASDEADAQPLARHRLLAHLASGSGRSWNFTTLLVVPFPPSM